MDLVKIITDNTMGNSIEKHFDNSMKIDEGCDMDDFESLFLTLLPREIHFHIFANFTNAEDLKAIGQVCKVSCLYQLL